MQELYRFGYIVKMEEQASFGDNLLNMILTCDLLLKAGQKITVDARIL